ncbi:sigma-70 family RNA polymerase sigma factor [Gracilimonas sp.]|uniref:sigma-70 family RNA polymerase sigma factor n=1 Tax=Gracilimonas sp. TaxID=1974203 RepID=UPI002871EF07|nr:sigma-70 family RNA polymerase sigma factor [Gracilimonas sp.]
MLFFILSTIGKVLTKDEKRDRAIMARIKARDPDALSELYDQYNRLLFGLILSILKKRSEAEDILQEVFTTIWEKADMYDLERGSVYTWIVSLTRNKSIDRLRSKVYKEQKKQSTSLDDEDVFHPLYPDKNDPLEDTILTDRAKRLHAALDKISNKQRKVLQVAYFNGMTQSEIADEYDIPLGTVKTRMRDGMMKLREILAKELEL